MNLFLGQRLIAEHVDKLKVELTYARVADEHHMVLTAPVRDVVHAVP